MNWKSGFLRLWIVTSAFWCALVLAVLLPPTLPSYEQLFGADFHVPKPSAKTGEWSVVSQEIIPWSPKDSVHVASIAVLPPILVFLFGVGIFWALQGFRKGINPQDSSPKMAENR